MFTTCVPTFIFVNPKFYHFVWLGTETSFHLVTECQLDMYLFQHTTTVNQICIDDNGDYIASCSDDGRVGNNLQPFSQLFSIKPNLSVLPSAEFRLF